MKKVVVAVVVIIVVAVGMFLVGRDYGSTECREYVIHNQEIHQDDTYYYVDLDGERYSYFKD